MIEKLAAIAALIESLFAHAHVLSLLIGQGIGLGLTQVVKYPMAWRMVHAPEGTPQHTVQEQRLRWSVRTFAVAAAGIGTYATWPNGNALWVALAACGMCPMVYWLILRSIGRWMPWLSVTRPEENPLPSPETVARDHDGLR